jgi:hypothetical protein
VSKRLQNKFNKAIKLNDQVNELVKEINSAFCDRFVEQFEEDLALMYQPGDGWVFVWGDSNNTPIMYMPELQNCLLMDKEEFFHQLQVGSI